MSLNALVSYWEAIPSMASLAVSCVRLGQDVNY